MNRTTKKKPNAKKPKSQKGDTSLLLGAIRQAARKDRALIAAALVESAKTGNNTALKALLDAVMRADAPKVPSRAESLKVLEQIEMDAAYGELSEETADSYPSGREPE